MRARYFLASLFVPMKNKWRTGVSLPGFRKSGADDARKLKYFEDFMFIHEELHVESISFQ